jgi:hypothetical protein
VGSARYEKGQEHGDGAFSLFTRPLVVAPYVLGGMLLGPHCAMLGTCVLRSLKGVAAGGGLGNARRRSLALTSTALNCLIRRS